MIALLLTLIIIGVIVYLVGVIPMDAKIAQLIRVVAIIIAVFVVLQAFGIIGGAPVAIPAGRLHIPR